MKRKLTTAQQLEAHDELIAELISKCHYKNEKDKKIIESIVDAVDHLYTSLFRDKRHLENWIEEQNKTIRRCKITVLLHSLALLAILYLLWLKL